MGCSQENDTGKKESGAPLDDAEFDRVFGCVAGAFCGDAAGGPLEFIPMFDETTLNNALEMKGGGKMKLGPGQITDDSELALCLAWGLYETKPVLNLENIAIRYRSWLDSPPFGNLN